MYLNCREKEVVRIYADFMQTVEQEEDPVDGVAVASVTRSRFGVAVRGDGAR